VARALSGGGPPDQCLPEVRPWQYRVSWPEIASWPVPASTAARRWGGWTPKEHKVRPRQLARQGCSKRPFRFGALLPVDASPADRQPLVIQKRRHLQLTHQLASDSGGVLLDRVRQRHENDYRTNRGGSPAADGGIHRRLGPCFSNKKNVGVRGPSTNPKASACRLAACNVRIAFT